MQEERGVEMIENRVTITDLEPIAMVAEAREDVELVTMDIFLS